MDEVEAARIKMLVQSNGKCPADEWLDSIRDRTTYARIERQIQKLARGLGVQKSLHGISELKIDIGPGYRIYYAFLDNKTVLVLIGGGDKSTQHSDIETARELWNSFETSGRPATGLRLWKEEEESSDESNDAKEL